LISLPQNRGGSFIRLFHLRQNDFGSSQTKLAALDSSLNLSFLARLRHESTYVVKVFMPPGPFFKGIPDNGCGNSNQPV
jgi:hypothetical protein